MKRALLFLPLLAACGPDFDAPTSQAQALINCDIEDYDCDPNHPPLPPPPQQLIVNGNFESTAGWTLGGAERGYCGPPYGACLWYSGDWNGAARQTFTIPADAKSVRVSWKARVFSDGYDMLEVALENPTTGARLKVVKDFFADGWTTTHGWTSFGPYDLTAYKGQTVRIAIILLRYSPGYDWDVDDVSVLAYR